MPATYPAFAVQWAPGIAPSVVPDPGDWVDITDQVNADVGFSIKWGRFDEFSEAGAGTASLTLDNSTGDWDPDNSSGPNYGALSAGVWFRILGGTTTANTDLFYGHVDDKGFQVDASQFADQWVTVDLVDDMEQLANTDLPESVWALEVDSAGPFAWYRLSESSGTVATDSSGNGHHGEYVGGATFGDRSGLIDGSDDSALAFADDVGIILPVGALPSVTNGDTAFSIEFWIETTAADATFWLLMDTRPSPVNLTVWLEDGDVRVLLWPWSGADTSYRSTVGTINDGEPHHVVITYSTAPTHSIYVDGVDVTSVSSSTALDLPTASQLFVSCAQDFTSPEAVWDEIVLYDRELTTVEVAAHYEAGASPWEGDDTGERIGKLLDAVSYDA